VAIDQADLQQQIEITAADKKMAPQISAGRVTDAQFFDQVGIAQSTLLQIACGLRMEVKLKSVEGGRLFQQLGNRRRPHHFLFEESYGLTERQIEGKLDEADQITAPTAAVTVNKFLSALT